MEQICYDIETTGLDPFTDRITAIGIVTDKEDLVITDKDEKKMIEFFWNYLKQFQLDGFKIIGFNNQTFDDVFIKLRSMKHNVKVIDLKYKSLDIRRIVFGYTKSKGKLEDFSKLIGYEPKYNGWSGKQIPLLWKNGNLDDLKEYVIQDAKMTWYIFKRIKELGML